MRIYSHNLFADIQDAAYVIDYQQMPNDYTPSIIAVRKGLVRESMSGGYEKRIVYRYIETDDPLEVLKQQTHKDGCYAYYADGNLWIDYIGDSDIAGRY